MNTARFLSLGAIISLASGLPAPGADTGSLLLSDLFAPPVLESQRAADPMLVPWLGGTPPKPPLVIPSAGSLTLACMPVLVRDLVPDALAAMPVARIVPDAFAIGRMPLLVPPRCSAPPP